MKKINNNIKIGVGTFIHETVEIMDGAEVVIGDHCYIGPQVKILPGKFTLGDYSKIHDRVNINPKRFVKLGHLSWIGQNSIVDGTGGLSAGNFLGVGIASCLYSHIRHGDITEGCRFDQNKEMVIGDDVWFVGQCLVSPIVAETKSVALLGSVIVKNMATNRVYGGNPAIDITDKFGNPWKEISTELKIKKMNNYITQFMKEYKSSKYDKDMFVVVNKYPKQLDDRVYYNVSDRTFTKHNYEQEIAFNKWLFPYKAKFIPIQK